jgi:hypothetical protein
MRNSRRAANEAWTTLKLTSLRRRGSRRGARVCGSVAEPAFARLAVGRASVKRGTLGVPTLRYAGCHDANGMESGMRQTSSDHKEAMRLEWKSRHIPIGTMLLAVLMAACLLSVTLQIAAVAAR